MMIQNHYWVRNWSSAFKFSSSILLYRLLIENFYIAKYLFITLLGGTKNNLVNLGKRLQTVDLSKGKAFVNFIKLEMDQSDQSKYTSEVTSTLYNTENQHANNLSNALRRMVNETGIGEGRDIDSVLESTYKGG